MRRSEIELFTDAPITHSRSSQDRAVLVGEIQECVAVGRGAYGSPRVHRELQRRGRRVSRKTVEHVMRENGLRGKKRRRFKITTLSQHSLQRVENVLAREFKVDTLNDIWAGDITCVWTLTGWLYLAVVLDLCSRRVVGWAIEEHMRDELVTKAMEMAIGARSPPRLFHSDQGSQYASFTFQDLLREHHVQPSMSRRGNCWDNAVVESFFDSLKTELDCTSPKDAGRTKALLFEYIEVFYNRQRLHSALDYRPPAEFEEELPRAA